MEKRLFSKILGRIGVVGLLLLCLCGCKTKYVAVPEWHTRDSVQIKHVRDSLFFHDSVYVSVSARNDTVIKEVYKWRYAYKDRLRTDTVVVSKTDSVTVVQTVERPLKWHDKAARFLAVAFLGLVAAFAVFLAVRK